MNTSSERMDDLLNEWKNWLMNGDDENSNEVDYITYIFYKMIDLSMYYEFYILRLFFLNREKNDSAESFFNRYQMSYMLPCFYKARGFFLTELNNYLIKKYEGIEYESK